MNLNIIEKIILYIKNSIVTILNTHYYFVFRMHSIRDRLLYTLISLY